MKPRILMFGWEFPPFNSGGLGVACQGLTKSLSERGFKVTFVMPRRLAVSAPHARMIFAESSDVKIRSVDSVLEPYMTSKSYLRERVVEGNTIYGRDLFEEVERYKMMGAEIAQEEEFDIIYAHDWLSFGAGVEAKYATGKPLIVHVHATEFDRCGGPNVNQHVYNVEKWGMEEADRVIAVSELTKQVIVDKYGIPASKVRVVHNGIDDSTKPAGAGWNRFRSLKASGYKIVLFLGRITIQKGPDYFVRAAARVLERNPKVMFVVSGSGDMEEGMMKLAADLNISQNVLFTGFLSGGDRHEMYTSSDLFVMPSISEPFGITPLEAMKLGTPVLISKQSGVSEIVQHAMKIDFWDVDEMANKILAIVGYPGLKETLSDYARQEADLITWADAAKKVDGIVRELVH
jgi:glycosyltransferase involved in cell wall biosynthesis